MADGVNSYLLFFSAGSHFLLPLSCVKRVTDMKEREPEMALADFLELPEAGNLSDQAYLIIADCGDREIGIRAEVVTGLVQVEEEQIYAIPEAVRSSRNQYMDAWRHWMRKRKRKTGVYSGPVSSYTTAGAVKETE